MWPVLDWSQISSGDRRMRICIIPYVFSLVVPMLLAAPEQNDAQLRESVQKWREDYEKTLKKDDGWLGLAGLYWLKPGDNSFGAALANTIVLPEGSAPEVAGTFIFRDGHVQLLPRDGVAMLFNGK